MQVHAVPDSERAYDSTGRQLPWGYDFADSDHAQRRLPEEKGPFGKARKRGLSRSRAATPAKKEDQAKLDNLRVIDDIFNRAKEKQKDQDTLKLRKQSVVGGLPLSTSTPNLGDSLAGGASTGNNAPLYPTTSTSKDPTEVILYGFGNDMQWAAISFYESVSNGLIYESYDRNSPTSKYALSTLSPMHAAAVASLSKQALRKVNEYVGGDHWIKITFDSAQAAETACHYSPHNLHGYLVYAERYRGTGPNSDEPIRAGMGQQRGGSAAGSPHTVSTATMGAMSSDATMSDATMRGTLGPRGRSDPILTSSFPPSPTNPSTAPQTLNTATTTSAAPATSSTTQPKRRSTLRVRGAKPATLLPADQAFLPAPSKWQTTFGSLPVLGWIVGSGHGLIGDQVPRKEDGSFDHEGASVYWRFWWMVDECFGTRFCGGREGDDE